ncbi:hypothetical protein ACWEOA_25905 [Streptomyces sp. NPDC004457]
MSPEPVQDPVRPTVHPCRVELERHPVHPGTAGPRRGPRQPRHEPSAHTWQLVWWVMPEEDEAGAREGVGRGRR